MQKHINALVIGNVRLVHPGERIAPGRLLIEDGRIVAIDPPSASKPRR